MTVTASTESFELRGVRNGSVVTVGWVHGRLVGDPPTVDLVEIEADLMSIASTDRFIQRADPQAMSGYSDPLARADSALALIRNVVDRITRLTVDTPKGRSLT